MKIDTIGFEIMVARRRAGLTQSQLAHQLGMSMATISNIERGVSNPQIKTLYKIFDILGVNFSIDINEENDG